MRTAILTSWLVLWSILARLSGHHFPRRGGVVNGTRASIAGPKGIRHRLTFVAVIAVPLAVVSAAASLAVGRGGTRAPGFPQPFAGTPKYQKYAPTEATARRQINEPLGPKAADRIARGLGLNKRHAFTAKQYRLFVSGKGVGGDRSSAKLVDQSVRILTNTSGTPLVVKVNGKLTRVVLGSYGLFVNTAGTLLSPANADAPT